MLLGLLVDEHGDPVLLGHGGEQGVLLHRNLVVVEGAGVPRRVAGAADRAARLPQQILPVVLGVLPDVIDAELSRR